MTSLLLKRTALFVAFVFLWALLTAAVSHAATHEVVKFSGFQPGTIVVKTGERHLYYVVDREHALRFPVGVGRKGKTWTGKAHVEGKYVKPSWEPPREIRRDHPNLPKVIPGGDEGNPMGAAALTLRGGEYAIHGTNNPGSIGGFVSYGCIRMYNSDIRALYRMVDIGTPVIVER
jgi:lipoprotein-anchoring transpeptidase ErfK/SrfK